MTLLDTSDYETPLIRDLSHFLCLSLAPLAATAPATPAHDPDTPQPPLTWKAAIDYKRIRDNAEAVQRNADSRAAACDVNKVITIYETYQTLNKQAGNRARLHTTRPAVFVRS